MNLGQLIRQKRKERNLTQTDVAKHIGVATNTVSKYERNIIENIGRDKIIALSKLLDIPTSIFIEAMDSENISNFEKVTPQEFVYLLKDLLEKTTNLSKEQKNYLLNTIEFICKDKE